MISKVLFLFNNQLRKNSEIFRNSLYKNIHQILTNKLICNDNSLNMILDQIDIQTIKQCHYTTSSTHCHTPSHLPRRYSSLSKRIHFYKLKFYTCLNKYPLRRHLLRKYVFFCRSLVLCDKKPRSRSYESPSLNHRKINLLLKNNFFNKYISFCILLFLRHKRISLLVGRLYTSLRTRWGILSRLIHRYLQDLTCNHSSKYSFDIQSHNLVC